jgi:hypothetical protein
MDSLVKAYLASIGAKGGKKSRRKLSPDQAREMALTREARKAYKRYFARCFWSYNPGLKITTADIPWVAEQLRKNGDRRAWEIAERLCR